MIHTNESAAEIYLLRKAHADRNNQRIAEAMQVLGVSDPRKVKSAFMHVVKDSTGIEPDRIYYGLRLKDGNVISQEVDRSLEGVRRYDKWFDNKRNGERYYFMRYQFCFQSIDLYVPTEPEKLIEQSLKREAKKEEQYRRRFPLLVLAEQG